MICRVASYTVNERAVEKAKRLIESRQYVLNSQWGDVQPDAAAENAYLESHSWDEYGEWYLGLTEGPSDESKARYAFVYGDFRRLHRTGIIACHYRAAEWRHKEIELAAHERCCSCLMRRPGKRVFTRPATRGKEPRGSAR